jgi:hypothetical protein
MDMPLSYAPLRDEILASVCLLSIGNARDGRGLTDIETHLGNPPPLVDRGLEFAAAQQQTSFL